jgi:hypothetical protein
MAKILGTPAWTSIGPAPILMPTGSATGAIQAVVGRRQGASDTFDLFLAAVNGGVWRSQNLTEAMLQGGVHRVGGILWTALTDDAASVSAASLALDPSDPAGQTLWVGTGQLSSSFLGGPAVGLLRTGNAGDPAPVWAVLGGAALRPGDVGLAGQRIVSVVPTTLIDGATGRQVVLVAAFDGQGVLRSADAGASFQRVQGPHGPLSGSATDLMADPNQNETYYAAIRATFDDQHNLIHPGGVFRSADGGRNWTEIDNGIPRASRSASLKLCIFDNARGVVGQASSTVLYAGEADTSGNTNNLIGLFRCENPRDPNPMWSAIFSDADPHHVPNGLNAGQWPAAAAVPWFALAVDRLDWNTLYAGGMSWLYRVQVIELGGAIVGSNWAKWDDGAFYDHRSMAFVSDDLLLSTGDQGVFALQNPSVNQPWVSLNNAIAVTEFYAVGFDPTTGFVCGGAQDVGTPAQNAYGSWGQLPQGGGDGGLALVGSDGVYFYEENGNLLRTSEAWSSEEDLAGVLATSPAACTWGPGRVDSFYAGQNSHLWHRWFDGDWQAEEDLGGSLTSAPGACTWGPGRVDIFYRGQNDHLWHRWFDGGWQAEEDLGGVLASAPGACTWGPGRVDIFYRGQNSHLWRRWFDGGWQAEEDLGGVLTSAPAACTWGPGRIDIFYRGQNDHLWHRWFDGGWQVEEDLGGLLTSAPAACTWGPGRVDIFYRGQNNHLWRRSFDGGWLAEEDIGGVLSSDPAACSWATGRIDVFYRGQNNDLWHRSYDRTAGSVTPAAIPSVTGPRGVVVNPADPRFLLVSTAGRVLESPDRGDTVRDITPQGLAGAVRCLAYGTDNPSVAFVGTSSGQLFLRQNGDGAPAPVPNYPGNGAAVDNIAVDATDWRRAVTISDDGRLLLTVDGGGSWTNIRGNVGDMLNFMRSIVLVTVGADLAVLVAGDPPSGRGGVVRTVNPAIGQVDPNVLWEAFGAGLPHTNILDLHYCPAVTLKNGKPGGDLVLAGTLGRGAWVVEGATQP